MSLESLATNLLSPASWTSALDLTSQYPGAQPLEVDLGCGNGRFLLARAAAHPEHNFLGIDRLLGRLRKIDRRAARLELTNLRLLRIENAYATQYLLPAAAVSVFYVFFPDPWPKRRHHRRRLFSPEFLARVHAALAPEGIIHVATDHGDYAQQIRRCFAATPGFQPIAPYIPSEAERTDFECHFVKQGLPIHRCSFGKV